MAKRKAAKKTATKGASPREVAHWEQAKRMPDLGIIGIDPGGSGGISYVWDGGAEVWKMPPTFRDQWNLIVTLSLVAKAAVIERVSAMRKPGKGDDPGATQGVSSSFKFGKNAGGLEAFLTAADLRFDLVSPIKWQNALQCRTGGDKNITKAAAQRRWPGLKVIHATADALLLGEYGRLHADWCQ